MRLAFLGLAIGTALLAGLWFLRSPDVLLWVVTQQRAFQNEMANGVFAIKTGSPGAWFALLAASASYGFVHAVGPGHGKYLIGGVGLGSSVTTLKLLSLSILSSLAQALWAILLVYGGFFLLETTASQMTDLAEVYLAPMSYIAIGCVGLILLWRGLKSFKTSHHHTHGDCCGHAHGPSPDEVASLSSLRDAILLVLSIAIRPCTGAIFLLVIAWQLDIKLAGVAAVLVMGLGTAALTSLVAVSSIAARNLTFSSATSVTGFQIAFPAVQVFAGAMIILFSLGLLGVVM